MWLLSSRRNLIIRVGTELTYEAVALCDTSLSYQLAADVADSTYHFRALLLLTKSSCKTSASDMLLDVREQHATAVAAVAAYSLVISSSITIVFKS